MSTYKIKLNNIRLSFPSLFKPAEFNGDQGKYEATFLMDKKTQAKMIEEVEAKIALIQKDNKAKVAPDKICLKDGEYISYDGYDGCMAIKANSNRRPTVIDRDKSPITEDDNKIYAGCYVNCVLELWFMNNNFGKRVCCNLLGVQFAKDGESFGAGPVDASDDFADISDDEMLG